MTTTTPFNTFIAGLTAATSVSPTDTLYIEQGGSSKRGTVSQLFTSIAPITVGVRSSSATTVTASASSDYFLALDPSSNAIAVNLPASPATGLTFLIKDATGNAGIHNITITPAAGNIDGAANFVMNVNFQSTAVTYTGTQWSIN